MNYEPSLITTVNTKTKIATYVKKPQATRRQNPNHELVTLFDCKAR